MLPTMRVSVFDDSAIKTVESVGFQSAASVVALALASSVVVDRGERPRPPESVASGPAEARERGQRDVQKARTGRRAP